MKTRFNPKSKGLKNSHSPSKYAPTSRPHSKSPTLRLEVVKKNTRSPSTHRKSSDQPPSQELPEV